MSWWSTKSPFDPPCDNEGVEKEVQEAFGPGKHIRKSGTRDTSPGSTQYTNKCNEKDVDDELSYRVRQQPLGGTQTRPQLKIAPPKGERYDEVNLLSFSNDVDLNIENNPPTSRPFKTNRVVENPRHQNNPPSYDDRFVTRYLATPLSLDDGIDQYHLSERQTYLVTPVNRTTGGLTRSPQRFNNLNQYATSDPRSNPFLGYPENRAQSNKVESSDEERPPTKGRGTEDDDLGCVQDKVGSEEIEYGSRMRDQLAEGQYESNPNEKKNRLKGLFRKSK